MIVELLSIIQSDCADGRNVATLRHAGLAVFFPQHNVEGLLNSCPDRVSVWVGLPPWETTRMLVVCSLVGTPRVGGQNLVLSPSRSDLVVQSCYFFFRNPHREIYNQGMVSGPVFNKIKGKSWILILLGVKSRKKKRKS